MTTPLRVIQWATGNTGARALREVIRHPNLELVGVRVYDSAKEGVDAGKLCGEEPTGITATTDRAAILELDADCVVYMPTATGAGRTRSGLSEEELLDDVLALVGSGTNIVTTCTDFFAGGHKLGDEGRARVAEACAGSGASIHPSGSNPGFMTDVFPFALLLSVQRRVDLIEIEEFGDVSRRESPHMLFEQMRFGKPVEEFDSDRRGTHLMGEYAPPLGVIADAAGFTVDEWTGKHEVAMAKKDTTIVAGDIQAGTAAAQRVTISGHAEGSEVIRFIQYAYCTKEIDPEWELRRTGWRVRIDGDAPFDADLAFPVPLEDLGDYVPAYNANLAVNAIPYVCAAKPGILSSEDLPPILPRGPRPADE